MSSFYARTFYEVRDSMVQNNAKRFETFRL